ncbi:MAG TPA: hypothetical protein VFF28_06155 [Candidatus Nanoarchaeia archaeon]|nr:hypothetical protein [Candidatus Nanoarchaeia archaeon]
MDDKTLSNYIRKMLSLGYPSEVIEKSLVRQGINASDIQKIISSFSKPKQHFFISHPNPKHSIIALVFFAAATIMLHIFQEEGPFLAIAVSSLFYVLLYFLFMLLFCGAFLFLLNLVTKRLGILSIKTTAVEFFGCLLPYFALSSLTGIRTYREITIFNLYVGPMLFNLFFILSLVWFGRRLSQLYHLNLLKSTIYVLTIFFFLLTLLLILFFDAAELTIFSYSFQKF